jgi:hypothetical protein
MPYATYKATEAIASGHTLNNTYTLSFQVQQAAPRNEILKREQRSLSGQKETLFYGNLVRWSIMLAPFPAELLPYYEEFLKSTADGQVFVIDPYGSELSPVKLLTVDRDDTGHTLTRMVPTGDPQYSDMWECSFEVSERS